VMAEIAICPAWRLNADVGIKQVAEHRSSKGHLENLVIVANELEHTRPLRDDFERAIS
jgi:hypothetical protein